MLLIDIAKLLIFPTVMAFAASSDLFTMTISNRISLILTAGFFALALGTGMPLVEIGNHVAAGALVLALAFFFFIRRWVGGGDAKLAAATALWFGFDHLVVYLAYAGLAGGVLTLLLLQFRKLPLPAPYLRGIPEDIYMQQDHQQADDSAGADDILRGYAPAEQPGFLHLLYVLGLGKLAPAENYLPFLDGHEHGFDAGLCLLTVLFGRLLVQARILGKERRDERDCHALLVRTERRREQVGQ